MTLFLVACGQESTGQGTIVYNGQLLPTPIPGSTTVVPPPAWIIRGDSAVPATYGTYCYAYERATPPSCADWFGELPPQLSPASLTATDQPTIIIGTETASLSNIQAKIRPLSEANSDKPEYQRMVTIAAEQSSGTATLILEPIGDVRDQLLEISVTFEGRGGYGNASYLWRLNP